MVHHVCRLLTDPNNSYGFIVNEISNTYNINVCVGTIKAIALGKIWRNISSQYVIPFRSKIGENQSQSKLTEQEVHFICQQYKLGHTPSEIIRMLGKDISVGAITSIFQGENWKHISSQYNLIPHSGIGESNHNAKLTEQDVRFIREQYHLGKTADEILELLGKDVSIHTVKSVIHNQSWKHVQ